MSYGYIKLGRIDLREVSKASNQINAQTGENTVALAGTETTPPLTLAALRARREDMATIRDSLVPVTFSQKTDLNGYYVVKDVGLQVTDWYSTDGAAAFAWTLTLTEIGPPNSVDLESRLTGIARSNPFALTGNRWHAPPIGSYGYFTGSTLPGGNVDRVGEDGTIRAWLTLPANVDPRWGADPVDFIRGRVRLLSGGLERAGTNVLIAATGWELSNGLLRIRPAASGCLLTIDSWDAPAFAPKLWNISVNGTDLFPADTTQATIIRNDIECATLRLLVPRVPGRTLIDLTLRRGSRFVEVFIQTDTSTTLTTHLENSEATTDNSASGYVVASGNDADGNRYIAGSSKSFTNHANGGVSKASTTTLDAFVGLVFGGGSPATGDGATAIRDQYIGVPAERVMGVLR